MTTMNKVNNIEIMRRHLGQGGNVELINDDGTQDTIYMPLITVEDSPEFIVLATKLSKLGEKFITEMSNADATTIQNLIINSLRQASPSATDDELGQFVVANFMPLMTKLFEINKLGVDSMNTKDAELVKKIKERANNAERPKTD